MQRYFVSRVEHDDIVVFSKGDSYHIQKVMRMQVDDMVEVIVDSKLYVCKIVSMKEFVTGKIIEEVIEERESDYSVVLVQSLVKEQKMDFILQKCTELGVAGVYPYQADRSIVRLQGKEEKKLERWRSIVKEASEQSKRLQVPFVGEVLDLNGLVSLDGFDYKFICTVNESEKSIKKVLLNLKKGDSLVIVIGPEGGFQDFEEKTLIDAGFIPVSLGKTVLRTETAGLFFLSAIRYIEME